MSQAEFMTVKDSSPPPTTLVEKPLDDTTEEQNIDVSSGITSSSSSPPSIPPIEESEIPVVFKPWPPSYPPVQRGDDDDVAKCCRICLECDHPQDMIAPCKCKGSSKWVHRQCLNQWRITETDRAFSKCTECLFVYHLQPASSAAAVVPSLRRRVKYTFIVARDVCLVTLYLQLAIALLGSIVALIDSDRELPRLMETDMAIAVYYFFGFLAVLVIVGCSGMMLYCCNNCSVQQSLAQFPAGPSGGSDQPTYQERSAYYQQSRQNYQSRDDCCANCYLCCGGGGSGRSGGSSPPPQYYGDFDECCDICLCCCPGGQSPSGAAASAASSGSSSSSDCCGGCDGDGAVILLFILLAILLALLIFLAIIGFVIGMVLCVVIFQRTLQRHIYILHKRQLAGEFQVMDLAGYDFDQEWGNNAESEDLEKPQHQPTAPTLTERDAKYLRDLGLLEEDTGTSTRRSWSSTIGVQDD